MIPAAIVAWQRLGPGAPHVRALDPATDAAAAAAAKETLAASLGRDAHAMQYAATPEGARALAEDMAAVNLDLAARRPSGRCTRPGGRGVQRGAAVQGLGCCSTSKQRQ